VIAADQKKQNDDDEEATDESFRHESGSARWWRGYGPTSRRPNPFPCARKRAAWIAKMARDEGVELNLRIAR
jgi:hypothetical protein